MGNARVASLAGHIAVRVLDFAAARGHDAERLCREHGLVLSQLREPGRRIPYGVVQQLGERVLELTRDPNLGLHLALDVRDASTFDAGVLLMMSSPTLRAALQRSHEYQRYWADGVRYTLCETPRGVTLRYMLEEPLSEMQRHSDECALLEILLGARRLTGASQLTPLAVRFRHAIPADVREHTSLFGLTPEFGAEHCEIELSEALLELPLPQANEAFRLFFEDQVERALAQPAAPAVAGPDPRLARAGDAGASGLREQVRAAAQATLSSGRCSMAETARTLGISARTLQRRLRAEGTSFAELLDALRRELAHGYLAEAMPLQQIAWRLGYADATAFHHAFKRWTGVTPKRARERGGGGGTVRGQ